MKVTDYIIRFEVQVRKDHLVFEFSKKTSLFLQHRGAIHCHVLLSVTDKYAPSHQDLMRAYGKTDCTEEEKVAANEKVSKFATMTLGISATHPNPDPNYWPGPLGGDPYTPSQNILRQRFLPLLDEDPHVLLDRYEKLVNRTMIHNCKEGYCLSPDRKDKDGHLICRFGFPKDYHGYEAEYSPEGDRLVRVTRTDRCPEGAEIVDGDLALARSHPNLVQHSPELMVRLL